MAYPCGQFYSLIVQPGMFCQGEVVFRSIAAALIALCIALCSGQFIIYILCLKKGQYHGGYKNVIVHLRESRGNIPTMGGIIVLIAAGTATFLCGKVTHPLIYQSLLILAFFAYIGMLKDWYRLKMPRHGREISCRKLFFLQGLGGVVTVFMLCTQTSFSGQALTIAFTPSLTCGSVFVMILLVCYIWMFGISVTLVDAMERLNIGCLILVFAGLIILTCLGAGSVPTSAGRGHFFVTHFDQTEELCILWAAIAGALLGYLRYDWSRVVFFGYTGSLSLGIVLAYGIIATWNMMPMFFVAIIFWFEFVCIMANIFYFKTTGGRRLFLTTPIYQLLRMRGWSVTKTASLYAIITIIMVIWAVLFKQQLSSHIFH